MDSTTLPAPQSASPTDNSSAYPVTGENVSVVTRTTELQKEYDDIKQQLNSLRSVWSIEEAESDRRRNLRMMKVNVKQRQAEGLMKKDETFIPVRVIQDNISKEQAQSINYITGAKNVVIFKSKGAEPLDPATQQPLPVERLSEEFTKLAKYDGWEFPLVRCIDGSETHGWDFVEVCFDADKPGRFSIEHIRHERLWFPEDTEDANFQDAPILVRKYLLPKKKLKEMFPEEESKQQIDKIFYDRDQNVQVNKSLGEIYKAYYHRDDGIVYTCWLNPERGDWFVREPMPLYRGRKQMVESPLSIDPMTMQPIPSSIVPGPDIYETRYPIHPLPYMVTEDAQLIKTKGRAFLDEYVQEAASSLVSTMVNGFHRASQIMGSPKGSGMPTDTAIKQLAIELKAGGIFDREMSFWSMPYPDAQGLDMVNQMLNQNKQEAGQVSYATLNRDQPGDRKTAKEIGSSEQKEQMLSTVQLSLIGMFIRNIYTDAWTISLSQWEQGLIQLGDLGPEYRQTEYTLRPAGDIEVVQKNETLMKLMQLWPIVSMTPAAMKLLVYILTYALPDQCKDLLNAIIMGDPKNQTIDSLQKVLQEIITQHPEVVPPGTEQMLQQVLGNAEAQKNTPSNAPVGQEAQPGEEQENAKTSNTETDSKPTANAS